MKVTVMIIGKFIKYTEGNCNECYCKRTFTEIWH